MKYKIFKSFKKLHNANICHFKAHFCQNINHKGRKVRKGFIVFLSSEPESLLCKLKKPGFRLKSCRNDVASSL
jgi:hypothetical protein